MKTVIRNSYSPKSGDYCEKIVIDEETNKKYLFDCDGVWTLLDGSIDEEEILRKAAEYTDQEVGQEAADRDAADDELAGDIADEVLNREHADQEIWQEIEAIEASSDVVDIVGTKAELDAYDTSELKDNDIIKVLQDESRNDAITYYRWNGTAFIYVGAEGPYYTASETDALLADKQDKLTAGSNIQISNNVISATDTTYSAGAGINIDANNAISADNQLPNLELRAYFNGSNPETFRFNTDHLPIYFGGNIYWDSTNGYINAAGTTYTAGQNIQINNDVISATDTTYNVFDSQNAGLVPASTGSSIDTVLTEGGWQPLSHSALRFQMPDGTEAVWTENNYNSSLTIPIPAGAEVYSLSTITPGSYQFGIITKSGQGAITGYDLYRDIHTRAILLEYNYVLYTIISGRQTANGYSFVIQDVTSSNQDLYILEITDSTYGYDTVTKVNSQYTLPTASSSTLGGVKVGSNLSIDANGVLSATVPTTNNISQADWTALWQ